MDINVREVFARHAFFLSLMFLWMLLCDGVLYGMGIAWEVLGFLNVMSGCMVCAYLIKVGRQRSKRKKEIEKNCADIGSEIFITGSLRT